MAVFAAAGAIGSTVLGTVGITAAATTFGAIAVGFLTQAAVGLALNALAPKPSSESKAGIGGYRLNGRQPALDHQIIYGETRVGGAIVFEANSNDIVNAELLRVYAHTGHPIEGYRDVYIGGNRVLQWKNIFTLETYTYPDEAPNGTPITPSLVEIEGDKYDNTRDFAIGGALTCLFYDGTQGSGDGQLVARNVGWTSQHILRNCAYMSAIFFHGTGDSWGNGVPEITCVIRGKKVFDPRSGLTVWSDNPALCIRDYLKSDYGLGESSANIDDTLVSTAANVCDQPAFGTTKRFTCNGAFTTAVTPIDLLNEMLTSMGGLLWYSQGKWRMKPAYYVAPTVEFTEDDLRSSIAVKTRHSRRDNFNIVKGTFKGAQTNWEFTDYPEVKNQAFIDADNGQESVVDLNLPFTDNSFTARRIALIFLERNRQQLTVSASFGMKAFQVQVGDIIQLTVDRFGWSQKEFEVASWTFGLTDAQDLQVQMTLREISASVFDEAFDDVVYERDNTTLQSPNTAVAPGINLSSELRIINEQVAGVLLIDLSGGNDGFRDRFEVEYKKSTSDLWIPLGSGTGTRFEVSFIEDGNYDVRARSVNTLGVRSDYNTVSEFYITPFAAPPSTVQNFTGNVVGDSLHLSWDAVSDLDLSHYKIRYATETIGAQYQDAVDLILKVSRPGVTATVPAKEGTYFIKAVDKQGVVSSEASSFVVTTNLSQLQNLNVVETLAENPEFAGSKTSVARVDDGGSPYVTLDTTNLFDSTSGDFDDELGLFDGGGEDGQVSPTGIYEFSDYIDLGVKYTSRVRVDLKTIFLDYVNTFDSVPNLFDSREGDFDGDPTQFDLTSVQVQVSYTDDDPTGAPTWSSWQNITVSDISARAIRFRVILSTKSEKAAPAVTELSAEIDMPDRVEAESDLTYTGSRVITFPVPFKDTPSLGIAATLADGDRYEISSKSRTGFTITTLTGGSTSSNPTTIDYVAKGYGKEIA